MYTVCYSIICEDFRTMDSSLFRNKEKPSRSNVLMPLCSVRNIQAHLKLHPYSCCYCHGCFMGCNMKLYCVLLGVCFNGKAPHTPCCNLVALLYANVLYMTSSLVLEVNLCLYIYLCVGKPSPLCGLRTPTKINDSTLAAPFRDKWKIH